jgi:hypothetical protein
MDSIMATKEIAVKKYVVRLRKEERAQLRELLRRGKSAAKLQLKARILLKADVSRGGEGWSDSQIIKALQHQSVDGLSGAPTTGGGRL